MVSLLSPNLHGSPAVLKSPRITELTAKETSLALTITQEPLSIKIKQINAFIEASNLLIHATIDDLEAKCSLLFHCNLSGSIEFKDNTRHLNLSAFTSKPATISATGVSLSGPFTMNFKTNSSLNFDSESLHLEVESLKTDLINGSITFRANITDFSFENHGETKVPTVRGDIQSEYIIVENAPFILNEPRISGFLLTNLDTASAIFELRTGDQTILGASIQHDWKRTTGSLDLQLALPELSTSAPLSDYIDLTNLNFDLTDGEISLRTDIGWTQRTNRSWDFGGPLVTKLSSVSGYYNDTIINGANGTVTVAVENPFSLNTLNDQALYFDKVDAGLVFTDIETHLDINSRAKSFNLFDTKTRFLQGELSVPKIPFLPDEPQSQFNLILSGIDLEELATLMPYDGLEINGRVSGYLPIVLKSKAVEISNGYISALYPGGSIFYTPQNKDVVNPKMKLVNEALGHYNFETLDSTLNLHKDGEIKITVALKGKSPIMNGGQEINLNLNISDNLNSLLQSLLASRQIEEGFELRYSR